MIFVPFSLSKLKQEYDFCPNFVDQVLEVVEIILFVYSNYSYLSNLKMLNCYKKQL